MWSRSSVLLSLVLLVSGKEISFQQYFEACSAGGCTNGYMKKCASGGGATDSKHLPLGTLQEMDLVYSELNGSTTVIVDGNFLLHTKASSRTPTTILLNTFTTTTDNKTYSGEERIKSKSGWASQIVSIGMTLTVLSAGDIDLDVKTYAGSWGSVSCSWANASITNLRIFTDF